MSIRTRAMTTMSALAGTLGMLGIVGLVGGAGAFAQNTAEQSMASLRGPDHTFAMEAAQANHDEVTLGKMAADKATNSDVKKFAQRMMNDHSKAQDQLKDLPALKAANLPMTMAAEAKALESRLSRLSGSAFDKAYIDAMVEDHQKDIQKFERATRNVSNQDLKQWASNTLPVLQEHLQQARQIQQELSKSQR
jgi:putative membrane protein